MEKVMLIDLQKKGLISTRLFNTLLREYFRIGFAEAAADNISLQDIVNIYTTKEIKQFRNMGQASYKEFENLCEKYGLLDKLTDDERTKPVIDSISMNQSEISLIRISERINAIEVTPDTEWKELYQRSASIINEELEKFGIDKIKTYNM